MPSSTARMTSDSSRISTRLTTNPGESTTSTPDFFSCLVTANAVARAWSPDCLGAHHLDQRHHGDRVEEVQADDALGVLQAGGHRRDRQRRLVLRGEHAVGAHDCLEVGEDLACLTVEVLEHRLDDEVGVGEGRAVGADGDQLLQRRRGSGRSRLLATRASRSAVSASRGTLVRRASSTSIRCTGTPSRSATSTASWRAISPAPTRPTNVTGSRLDVGHADRTLGALLHEVEGVERRGELGAQRQVGERLVLGGEARPPAALRERWPAASSARCGAGGTSLVRAGDELPRRARCAASHSSSVGRRGASTVMRAGDDGRGPGQRLLDEVGAARASRRRCRARTPAAGLSIRLLLSGFSMITVTALSGPTRFGQQRSAAPAGDQAEEHLGQGERRRRRPTRCGRCSAARPRGRRPCERR